MQNTMSPFPWRAHYDPGVPASIEYPEALLNDFLDRAASRYPAHPGLILNQEVMTYAQMQAQVARLAGSLAGLGIKKGDCVGFLMPNLPEFVIAFYASVKIGAIVMALNPQYTAREIAYQANDAGITLLLAFYPLYSRVKSIQLQTGIQRVVVIERGETFAPEEGIHVADNDLLWGDLIRSDRPMVQPAERVTPEDPAIFQYTGGTTGVPKCAVGLHRNLVANSLQFRHWLVNTVEGQETFLVAIPMYHVYGMVLGMSLGIMLAARIVLAPNPRDIPALLETLEAQKVTIFPGVPSLYNAMLQHPGVQAGQYNLRTIKACISGSAPLPRLVKESFEALTGGRLVEGYGLSEAPTATHCNPILGENRTGSIGLPLPDVECRIVSLEDGLSGLAPGQAGELVVRGPQVMAGYHALPEETRAVLREGWLYTGDIARMDEDGYFYLVDRKKDVIKSGGFQVWPSEVEAVINAHPKVLESAVAGVRDPWRGEVVMAWVVVKNGESLSAAEVRAWCRESLARYKVPSRVEFLLSLPRTSVGKLLRRELVRPYEKAQN